MALGFSSPGSTVAGEDTYSSMPSIYNVPKVDAGFLADSNWAAGTLPWAYDQWKSIFGKIFSSETDTSKSEAQQNQAQAVTPKAVPQDNNLLIIGVALVAIYFAWPYVKKGV
jgi:hypothetical protein